MSLAVLVVLISGVAAVQMSGAPIGQPPVNPNASPEAKALLEFLYKKKGTGIITGNHNEQEDPTNWDRKLKSRNGGIEPALYGNDFRYGRYVKWRQRWIDEAIKQWEKKGKIITIMYHQARPIDDEASASFSKSVQGKLSYDQFEQLLTANGNPINEAWKTKMDSISILLQQLEDKNIPVLFRPYHEMNGDWFWWGGKKDGEQYKRLFRMTYDYLTTTKGLDNLLWVLNFDDVNNNLSDYYPGDDYVDALATDIYGGSFDVSHYQALKTLANGRPIAVGEVGTMIPMDEMESTYPDYVWIMGWRKLFVDENTPSTLSSMFKHRWAINRYINRSPWFSCVP